jgi:hypothetical protein
LFVFFLKKLIQMSIWDLGTQPIPSVVRMYVPEQRCPEILEGLWNEGQSQGKQSEKQRCLLLRHLNAQRSCLRAAGWETRIKQGVAGQGQGDSAQSPQARRPGIEQVASLSWTD